MTNAGGKKAVIGVSGGKDSSVIAALCLKALGNENVIGVLMPDGVQKDISDSKDICNLLDIKNINVNIEKMTKALLLIPHFLKPVATNMSLYLEDILPI